MSVRSRSARLLSLVGLLLCAGESQSAEKITGTLLVKDGLGVPHQSVTIEAKLIGKGLFARSGMGGEPLELVIDGQVVGTAMTGGDGKARLAYVPKKQGIVPITVRVGNSPRVAPAAGEANLAVWERRSPIIVVEQAALIDQPSVPAPLPGIGLSGDIGPKPLPDAAEELAKLTQFYYRVIYAVPAAAGMDGFEAGEDARAWLKQHHFPAGYVLTLPPGEQAMGEKIDELHAAGWTTVKIGIGRTKTFAEAFLQRRLEAVIVPEPKKGAAPRKAKVAKDWKEVRKKL
jgi:hypothetical protein